MVDLGGVLQEKILEEFQVASWFVSCRMSCEEILILTEVSNYLVLQNRKVSIGQLIGP